jgi:hypothetical protein
MRTLRKKWKISRERRMDMEKEKTQTKLTKKKGVYIRRWYSFGNITTLKSLQWKALPKGLHSIILLGKSYRAIILQSVSPTTIKVTL